MKRIHALMMAVAGSACLFSASACRASDETARCVTIDGSGASSWFVVNNCSVPVMGTFCYEGDSSLNACNRGGGGFGPIGAHGRESISKPQKSGSTVWHLSVCSMENWGKSLCAPTQWR